MNTMPKITNLSYRAFLDNGIISLLNRDDIEKALLNIKGKNKLEGRALVIALYYTAARPTEILELKGKHLEKENSYIKIQIPIGAKHGLPRPILISSKYRIARELYNYAKSIFPDQFLFYHYTGKSQKFYKNRKGETIEYDYKTYKIYYWVKKWFKGIVPDSITPYFLRHNKLSQLSEAGASMQELQQIKGARDPKSIQAYLHMSKQKARKLGRLNK